MSKLTRFKNTLFLLPILVFACGQGRTDSKNTGTTNISEEPAQKLEIVVAANRTGSYLPMLKGKSVAIVANPTSVIFKDKNSGQGEVGYTHLVDSLISLSVDIKQVFAPEHGFRGMADAGEYVKDGVDTQTKLPIVSLYGSNKKPTNKQLQGIDIVLFDIQDVGVRFYTYIATLQLVMEACAEAGIPVLVLDRPNPNGHYIDGPIMEKDHMGFLGMTPIPLVHGMTIGEYATMINEEGWLSGRRAANLTVIPMENYSHELPYSLPIRPSPNLPNDRSINLYPSLGLFEGTHVNAGRGTEFQFQRYGAPFLNPEFFDFYYTPKPNFGAKSPKHKDVKCYGEDLAQGQYLDRMNLEWLLKAYKNRIPGSKFFKTAGFTAHAGTDELQKQIENGWSEEEIRESWQEGLSEFRKIRLKYLLYP